MKIRRRHFVGLLSLAVAAKAEAQPHAMQQYRWDHIEAFGWQAEPSDSLDPAPLRVYEMRGVRSDGRRWFVRETLPASLDTPAERKRREQAAREALDRFLWM